jgi:hypothetical protein
MKRKYKRGSAREAKSISRIKKTNELKKDFGRIKHENI